MTDEKIKEEFGLFMARTVPIRDIDLSRTITSSVGDLDNIMIQSHAVGFIGGFRAAERLSKIEVLEDTERAIMVMEYPNDNPTELRIRDVLAYLENRIAELKEYGK